MTRKSWLKPPHSDMGRPGSVKATTLADVAKPGKSPAGKSCRICLAPETHGRDSKGWLRSSLKNGVCRDRAACEERQPPLIPLGEL